MTMTVKSAFIMLAAELRATAHAFFFKRSTQTHTLAFLLGAVLAVVALRVTTRPVEAPEVVAEPVIEEVAQPTGTVHQTDYDAECIARVLYGIRGYDLSDEAKTAVIEVIKNRVADTACEFRTVNTIVDVCEQPNQWQGYVSGGSYLKEDYELALDVLYNSSGARTIPEGCFFLVVNQGEVIARTKWDGGNEWSVR